MAIREVADDKLSEYAEVALLHALCLNRFVENQIQTTTIPRPFGFRSRVIMGDVLKITFPDHTIEYTGYPINLCCKLLDFKKGIPLICHENIRDVMPVDSLFIFRKIIARQRWKWIDEEDAKSLWVCKIKKGSEKHVK